MTPNGPAPQRDQLVDLTVTGLAFGGKGVARIDDFVVFVSGAVPGDVVRARVLKNKKRYAEARAEELVVPSPDRCQPRCPMFGSCGGCVWQDLTYQRQLEYKASQVRESLEHLGGLKDFELRGIVGMDSPWRYRNRADFSIGTGDNGAVVGFRPPGNWDSVLPLSECHLLEPSIEAVRATVEGWLREKAIPGWDPRTGSGFARHLLARSSQEGQELIVSLVTASDELPYSNGLVEQLRAAHPQVVGILHAVNLGSAELSSGLPSQTLWGRPFLLERVAGLTLKVSIDAFFQTNTLMANQLYGLVADAARIGTAAAGVGDEAAAPADGPAAAGTPVPADGPAATHAGVPSPAGPVVWDLYSGVGAIGLALARGARAVLGIEAVPAAVEDARENARLNSIGNARFLEGDVAKVLREVADGSRRLPEGLEMPDLIVMDPPRAGLSKKAASRIGEVGAPALIYVSCNPTTLAPNVAQLREYGYRLDHVTPVDMFPHTPHVECVAVLSRRDS
jgi:23S rRNA (uracil1939-C5)-methyltransferase